MEEGRTDRPNRDRATSETTEHTTELRATVGEAAELLGITAEAVRSRIKRKTLKSTKEGSTVYVLLEAGGTHGSQNADPTTTEHDGTNAQTSTEHDRTDDRAELVDVLRDQVEYLREQLGEEREARRRADMLLARLADANAALAGEVRELTAPGRPLDGPETYAEASEGVCEPRPPPVEPQAGAQEPGGEEETARRPWWVRIFGG